MSSEDAVSEPYDAEKMLDYVRLAIPDDYYAHLPPNVRVNNLVAQWQRAAAVVAELEETIEEQGLRLFQDEDRMARLRDENDFVKAEVQRRDEDLAEQAAAIERYHETVTELRAENERLRTFERSVEQLTREMVGQKVRDLQAVAEAAQEYLAAKADFHNLGRQQAVIDRLAETVAALESPIPEEPT